MNRYQLWKVVGVASLVVLAIGLGTAVVGLPLRTMASSAGEGVSVHGAEAVLIRAGQTDKAPEYVPPPAGALADAPETATINVTYIGGWTPQAQAAFQYAVDIWETLITSAVTIQVEAEWAPLGGSILGAAGANSYFRDFSGAPVANVWYPVALANRLHGTDLDPGDPDINATFNSTFPDWYYATDGNTPFDKWDFVSVVLHEIGHGLGFAGSMRVGGNCGSGLGCWGLSGAADTFPLVYDLFTENSSGMPLLDFANFSSALASQLTSGDVYFDGPLANTPNGSQPVKLFAPGAWQQGSSYSHLDEATYNGTLHALMTPTIFNGEANHHPGLITLCLFGDMDWDSTAGSPASARLQGVTASVFGGPTPTAPAELAYLPAILKNSPSANLCTSSSPPPPGPSPFVNPGFESGPTGWTEFSAQGYDLILDSNTPNMPPPHTGTWAVWLGGDNNEEAYIQQSITVPPAAPYLA